MIGMRVVFNERKYKYSYDVYIIYLIAVINHFFPKPRWYFPDDEFRKKKKTITYR